MKTKSLLTFVLVAVLGSACNQGICPDTRLAAPVERVIADYNLNASKIPRLWARAEVSMTFREKPSDLGFTWRAGEATSYLLLDKTMGKKNQPADFVLIVKETVQEIARLGISTEENVYYTWFNAGENKKCFYGRLPLAGAPGVRDIPVDPVQLLGVLAVCELPEDLTSIPLVAQTYSHAPCAYVLTLIDRQPVTNKLLSRKEVYFDRTGDEVNGQLVERPRRPFMVRIFDNHGRRVLTARLGQYMPVSDESGQVDKNSPVMPSEINLRWWESGTEIHLSLSGMTTKQKVVPEAYRFASRLPAGLKGRERCVDRHINP